MAGSATRRLGSGGFAQGEQARRAVREIEQFARL